MGVANKQAASPSKDTIAQAMIVIPQPEASAIFANTGVAIAAPIYVQAFTIPENVATLPLLANLLGTTDISIRFIPCMQAIIIATMKTDNTADDKSIFTKYIAIANASEPPNMTAAQKTSLRKTFLCKRSNT